MVCSARSLCLSSIACFPLFWLQLAPCCRQAHVPLCLCRVTIHANSLHEGVLCCLHELLCAPRLLHVKRQQAAWLCQRCGMTL